MDKGRCPYTKSGDWPDRRLVKIIKSALKSPKELCPDCMLEVVYGGSGEVAWCECPKCSESIGSPTIM